MIAQPVPVAFASSAQSQTTSGIAPSSHFRRGLVSTEPERLRDFAPQQLLK